MTSKDKAKELISKFMPHVRWKLGQEDCIDRAKECALVAVDVMLNFQENLIITEGSIAYKYWQDVKTEINNANRI
jgi:hypothetical protein